MAQTVLPTTGSDEAVAALVLLSRVTAEATVRFWRFSPLRMLHVPWVPSYGVSRAYPNPRMPMRELVRTRSTNTATESV